MKKESLARGRLRFYEKRWFKIKTKFCVMLMLLLLSIVPPILLTSTPTVSAWFPFKSLAYSFNAQLTDYNEERTLWSTRPLFFNSYSVEPRSETTIEVRLGLTEYWPWGTDQRYIYVFIPSSVSFLGWEWHPSMGTGAKETVLTNVYTAEHSHESETYRGDWYVFEVTGNELPLGLMMEWILYLDIFIKNPMSGIVRVFAMYEEMGTLTSDLLGLVFKQIVEIWLSGDPITVGTIVGFVAGFLANTIIGWFKKYALLEIQVETYSPPPPGPDPDPSFASSVLPDEMTEKSVFYVEFVVLNDGGISPEAYATVSFSGGLEVIECNGELHLPGSMIWHRDGYQIPAQNKMIDYIATPFPEGNTRVYWARVEAGEAGDQWIAYRLCFDKYEVGYQWVYNPTEAESTFIDQQGWPVYNNSVTVWPSPVNVLFDVIASAPDEAIVGDEFTVTAYVENEGTADAHNVIASLSLSAGLSLVSGEISQNLGDIPPGVEVSCNWAVRADYPGEFTLSVEVFCDELSGYEDDETILVHETPSISCEINVPERVAKNLQFHVVSEVTNTGETWIYELTTMLTFSSNLQLVHGDNPQEEEKLFLGETWKPNWLLKAIAPGPGWVEVDVDSVTGVDCQDHKTIELYDPEFSGTLIQTLSYHASSVATGDIDGDEISDIAIGSADRNVYAVKSDGNLLWNYSTDAEVMAVSVGDMDGDGYADVACGTGEGIVYAIKSDGILFWQHPGVDNPGWWIWDVEVGDFDGDGKMDVASSSSGWGKVCAFKGDTGDLLWAHLHGDSCSSCGDIQAIAVGDVDGDGCDDVAVGVDCYKGVFVYSGDENGKLLCQFPEVETVKGAIAVGDLDGDGKDEVVAGSKNVDTVYAFDYPCSKKWDTSGIPEIRCVDVGDLDGDGNNDVAVGTENIWGHNVVALRGSDGDVIWTLPLGDEVFAIDIGDLDDDGINDVAAGGYSDHNVWVILSPSGTIFWNYTVDSSVREHCVIIDDINCDGVKDIIVAAHDGNVYILTCKVVDNDGPVTGFLSVDPNPCRTNPQLNATITDAVSDIVAAEYFIDIAGVAGSGTPMDASDGSFDSTWEDVTAVISISALTDGSHIVFVHGKDSANNSGEFSNHTFTVDREPPQTEITDGPSGVIRYKGFFFRWTALDNFTDTPNLEYSYILQGYDMNWSDWVDNLAIGYYNLSEGNYTFKVKARDQSGNIDPTPAERSFTIVSVNIGNFDALFALNDARVIYPSDITPKPLSCAAAWVSDWTASAFVTTKLQNYTEGLDTNGNFVNQTSGRPLGGEGSSIISFGGPIVNPIVKYAESNGTPSADRAPIKWYEEGGIFYFQLSNGSSIPGANLPVSVINHNEDMFVIEVYMDGSGRYIMICYGFGWKGTYAAGKYFDTIIYPNLGSYDNSWMIVKWQDTNDDGFVNNPNDGDTYTIIAWEVPEP